MNFTGDYELHIADLKSIGVLGRSFVEPVWLPSLSLSLSHSSREVTSEPWLLFHVRFFYYGLSLACALIATRCSTTRIRIRIRSSLGSSGRGHAPATYDLQ